jgi:hypothetical protein
MTRFSIRELVLLTALVASIAGWVADHVRVRAAYLREWKRTQSLAREVAQRRGTNVIDIPLPY